MSLPPWGIPDRTMQRLRQIVMNEALFDKPFAVEVIRDLPISAWSEMQVMAALIAIHDAEKPDAPSHGAERARSVLEVVSHYAALSADWMRRWQAWRNSEAFRKNLPPTLVIPQDCKGPHYDTAVLHRVSIFLQEGGLGNVIAPGVVSSSARSYTPRMALDVLREENSRYPVVARHYVYPSPEVMAADKTGFGVSHLV